MIARVQKSGGFRAFASYTLGVLAVTFGVSFTVRTWTPPITGFSVEMALGLRAATAGCAFYRA
jgi:hypothetical protein